MEHYYYYKSRSGDEVIRQGRSHFFDKYLPDSTCIDLTKMFGETEEPHTLREFRKRTAQGKTPKEAVEQDIEFISDKFVNTKR